MNKINIKKNTGSNQFSLICPNNDLESQTILKIAEHYDLHIIEHPGDWGATLDLGVINANQDDLRKDVIIVELPNPDAENQLLESGHRLHIIDHHRYGDLDRSSPRSSLEQFAALINHRLTQREWYIAINDRSYIPGLHKAGCSFEEMLSIRGEERDIQGISNDFFTEAQVFWQSHRRELDDLVWCLAPDKFSRCLMEAAQLNIGGKQYSACLTPPSKPILFIYHEEGSPNRYTQIALVGNNRLCDRVDEVFTSFAHYPEFDTWSGGGQNNAFYGVKSAPGHPKSDWDTLLEQLFGCLLISGRPLVDYNCTLMLPLDLFLKEELGETKEVISKKLHTSNLEKIKLRPIDQIVNDNVASKNEDHPANQEEEKLQAQAYEYFYPQIRDQIFQRADGDDNSKAAAQGISAYRLKTADKKPAEQWTLTLDAIGKYPEIIAQINDLTLFQYYNGLYLLAIHLVPASTMPSLDTKNKDSDWWKLLVHGDEDSFETIQSRQVENWLHFTRLSRQLFAVFREQIGEDKFAQIALSKDGGKTSVCKTDNSVNFSAVISHLLGQFIEFDTDSQTRNLRLSQIHDDRMFVHASYALAGTAPDSTTEEYRQLRRLYSLALYVDRQFDGFDKFNGHAYDPAFVEKQLDRDSYDRWNANGIFIGFTSHSNVFMGVGGFFCNVISTEHVPVIYMRMAMVTHFYRATLLHFDRRITEATMELIAEKDEADEFRSLRADFIAFTNNHWFPALSPQMQGQDISLHMNRALGLAEKYRLVKDEMERADEYLASLHANKWAKIADKATGYALTFAIIALGLGIIDVAYKNASSTITLSAWGVSLGIPIFIGGCHILKKFRKNRLKKNE